MLSVIAQTSFPVKSAEKQKIPIVPSGTIEDSNPDGKQKQFPPPFEL
jgi:hypothetical protein